MNTNQSTEQKAGACFLQRLVRSVMGWLRSSRTPAEIGLWSLIAFGYASHFRMNGMQERLERIQQLQKSTHVCSCASTVSSQSPERFDLSRRLSYLSLPSPGDQSLCELWRSGQPFQCYPEQETTEELQDIQAIAWATSLHCEYRPDLSYETPATTYRRIPHTAFFGNLLPMDNSLILRSGFLGAQSDRTSEFRNRQAENPDKATKLQTKTEEPNHEK